MNDVRAIGHCARIMAAECRDCGRYLTPTEHHYYGYRCGGCEGKWFERIEAWRHGADDDELDEQFSQPKEK